MFENVHPSWQTTVSQALSHVDPDYVAKLEHDNWLPGPDKIFNAFSLAKTDVNYILLGESPYPRLASANGYAFWDAAVDVLWSDTGLSKPVNRATSLRNFVKMLLVAEDLLDPNDTSQTAISHLDKRSLVRTNDGLFNNMLRRGFLLLNATPVFREKNVNQDARAWRPFIESVLAAIPQKTTLLLFGKVAEKINLSKIGPEMTILTAEHPYNLSFVQNKDIISFFKPLRLLDKLL